MTKKEKKNDGVKLAPFDISKLWGDFTAPVFSSDPLPDTNPVFSLSHSWVSNDDLVNITLPDLSDYDCHDWVTTTTNVEFNDPYAELEQKKLDEEKEEELRREYPSLQDAYENYQLVKKLVEDSEFDKTFNNRYEGFSKK